MSGIFIKASEAARRLGVSLVTAKRMIGDQRLVGEKVGSRWQVDEQSVFDYLNKRDGILSTSDHFRSQNGDQEPSQTDASGEDFSISDSVEPFVGDDDRSSVSVEVGTNARARDRK